MSSGGGTSKTTVKPEKPVVVQNVTPLYIQQALADRANYAQQAALYGEATYRDIANKSSLARGGPTFFDPLKTSTGETIAPGQVAAPFDATKYLPSAEFLASAPAAPAPEKSSKDKYLEGLKRPRRNWQPPKNINYSQRWSRGYD